MASRQIMRSFPLRRFSSYDRRPVVEILHLDNRTIESIEQDNSKLGPICPVNPNFPLPGNISIVETTNTRIQIKTIKAASQISLMKTPQDDHLAVASQVISATSTLPNSLSFPNEVKFFVQVCPTLVRKDLGGLFPDRDLLNSSLTVISLTQKSINDMSQWSEAMEAEHEKLIDQFITAALQICGSLKEAGYWADFIDPGTGKPYFGAYTNVNLNETDEQMKKFGFKIEDLGCCKVITDFEWGSHISVGLIFTTAHMSHPLLDI